MVDARKPWFKLTNISAAIMIASQGAAVIWPQYAIPARVIGGIALALLGVGIGKRVARFGEAANGAGEEGE